MAPEGTALAVVLPMKELEQMIAETREWREFHAAQYRQGVKGAQVEAAACAIREKALIDARNAVLREVRS